MPGLYLHIPFCRKACHYCNFHFSTSLRHRERMTEALLVEMDLQKDYFDQGPLNSVYIGGGTPSLLSVDELKRLLDKADALFSIGSDAEITLESNPDDLTIDYLKDLAASPFNRLSIGIQSFDQQDLLLMNRAHNAEQALRCIPDAQAAGFDNLTVDLIYGIQGLSDARWQQNMQRVFDFGVPHISSYCLTVEPGTAMDHFVRNKKMEPVNEEQSARQFSQLMEAMQANGYDHYEISNFARPGFYARHNSNYWLGIPYLGIGPSAHSFDGQNRQWNIAHNSRYLQSIEEGVVPFEREELSAEERYNEYVMTSIRTIWGCQLAKVEQFGPHFGPHFLSQIQTFVEKGQAIEKDGHYVLTQSGKLLADGIAMELFWVG
ncbi:MAG: radical SAM family heme chaperone HemW [Bacteroidota bacterium]